MRGFFFFLCFLFTLLAAAGIGHDIWHAANEPKGLEGIDFSQPLPFSDLGWVWKTYSIESYNWAHGNVDKTAWDTYIDPILKQKTALVTAVPAAIMYALMFILKLFGWWPFEGQGWLFSKQQFFKKSKDYTFKDPLGKKAKKFKYKRR